jgi:hypothetical protein
MISVASPGTVRSRPSASGTCSGWGEFDRLVVVVVLGDPKLFAVISSGPVQPAWLKYVDVVMRQIHCHVTVVDEIRLVRPVFFVEKLEWRIEMEAVCVPRIAILQVSSIAAPKRVSTVVIVLELII